METKNKATFLLISAILVLCLGFIIAGCGNDPQLKASEPEKGQFALDFTDCPIAGSCLVTYESNGAPVESLENKASGYTLTIEAWIKPKSTSTGIVIGRGTSRGATLSVISESATEVKPRFEIRRVVDSPKSPTGTSTARYLIDGNAITVNALWHHIAGVLTNTDHSNLAFYPTHPVCLNVSGNPDATIAADPWHLDIYQNGTITACTETYGGTTVAGDSDPTVAADSHAHEPEGHTAGIQFLGIIDEVRIWNINRENDIVNAQWRNRELDSSELMSNMILYSRFNRGEGADVSDWSGVMGNGVKEYPLGGNVFADWETGWTTETPF